MGDKSLIVDGIQYTVDSVVQESVADYRFVNVSWFRVTYVESFVLAMRVRLSGQVTVQVDNVIHQVYLEFLHVFALPFPQQEFLPGQQKIFHRGDIIESHEYSQVYPPPQQSTTEVDTGGVEVEGYVQSLAKLSHPLSETKPLSPPPFR